MSAIEFKNVYFKYDKSLPIVLNDVSLKVEYNKITLLYIIININYNLTI